METRLMFRLFNEKNILPDAYMKESYGSKLYIRAFMEAIGERRSKK